MILCDRHLGWIFAAELSKSRIIRLPFTKGVSYKFAVCAVNFLARQSHDRCANLLSPSVMLSAMPIEIANRTGHNTSAKALINKRQLVFAHPFMQQFAAVRAHPLLLVLSLTRRRRRTSSVHFSADRAHHFSLVYEQKER